MYPIAHVLKSEEESSQNVDILFKYLTTYNLKIHICHQNIFFIHVKYQDVGGWLQMRSTTFKALLIM